MSSRDRHKKFSVTRYSIQYAHQEKSRAPCSSDYSKVHMGEEGCLHSIPPPPLGSLHPFSWWSCTRFIHTGMTFSFLSFKGERDAGRRALGHTFFLLPYHVHKGIVKSLTCCSFLSPCCVIWN